MNVAIVAAGGKGTRFAGSTPKQFSILCGKPLLMWSVELFESVPQIDQVLLAYCAEDGEEAYRSRINAETRKVRLVAGGATRFDSVRNAFRSIQPQSPHDAVLIHDAGRPLVSHGLVARVLGGTMRLGTALPVMPVQETLKEVEPDRVIKTWPRDRMAFAQTPQGFRYDILQKAYEWADQQGLFPQDITDEAFLVEKAGFAVHTVAGEKRNLKITDPEDLELALYYMEEAK